MHLYKIDPNKMVATSVKESVAKAKKTTKNGINKLQQATEYLYINLHSLFLIVIYLTIIAIDSSIDTINTKTSSRVHKVLERKASNQSKATREFDLLASFMVFSSTILLTTLFILIDTNLIADNTSLIQIVTFKIALPVIMCIKGLMQYINLVTLVNNEQFSFKHGYEIELTVKILFAKSLNSKLVSTNTITLGISDLKIQADSLVTNLYLLTVEKLNKVFGQSNNRLQKYLQTNNIQEFNASVVNMYLQAQQRARWSPAVIKTNYGYLSKEDLLDIRSQITISNAHIAEKLKIATIKGIATDHPAFTTSWPLAISMNPVIVSYNNMREISDLDIVLESICNKTSITQIALEDDTALKDSSYAKLQELTTIGTLISYKNFTSRELNISKDKKVSTLIAAALNYMDDNSFNLVQSIANLKLPQNKKDINVALRDLTAQSRCYLPNVAITNNNASASLVKMCKLLLSLGADVNQTIFYKTKEYVLLLSPLLNATRAYNKELVSLLLQTKKILYPSLEIAIAHVEKKGYQDNGIKSLLLDYRKNNYLYVYRAFKPGYYVSRKKSSQYMFSSIFEKFCAFLIKIYNYLCSFISVMNKNPEPIIANQNIDPIQDKISYLDKENNSLMFREENLRLSSLRSEIESKTHLDTNVKLRF